MTPPYSGHRNRMAVLSLAILLLAPSVLGHVAVWHKGMYCLNGTIPGVDVLDNNAPVSPLFNLSREDWWMHHVNKCDEFPPDDGDFLELPAGGSFVTELAVNRAFTSLSYNGSRIGTFIDGQEHPGLGETSEGKSAEGCITEINIHTMNESMAAGTAFAISYNSDIKAVTPENLVVFTVLYHTPWHRVAEYKVPDLPACPPGGCHCAWGWVANGCGMPNMYMQPLRCKVVGQTGSKEVAPGKPPVWCEDDPSRCVSGPKQMVFWHQLEGNNVDVSGFDLSGRARSPAYNNKMGFSEGAQTDIFLDNDSATPTFITPGPSSTPPGFSEPAFTSGSGSNGSEPTFTSGPGANGVRDISGFLSLVTTVLSCATLQLSCIYLYLI
ncbi:hypothetical protein D9611_003559 [Ephemerocybe angulata]|uniref:Uncharacterized protein n=1 Tax=Ephemerocybe angulata TaxID=980116 RepID=A0A8H5EZ28_9AGAR|nr:hypothetical protein D9611_003559 [Tulosesus angulatus]